MRLKIDYYKFDVYAPYICGGECHQTLMEAKESFLRHLSKGDSVGDSIHGCTRREEGIYLTYTPYYTGTGTFGRTEVTNIGRLVQRGVYGFLH